MLGRACCCEVPHALDTLSPAGAERCSISPEQASDLLPVHTACRKPVGRLVKAHLLAAEADE